MDKPKGVYSEDYSAKDFNRPEWKKLIKKIRKNTHRPPENILFIKWARFSRSIVYAYQMIRMLRDLNVLPVAIDQPIDIEVPESIVMLAVDLSTPEAENCRRGLTTSDGIRRAKKMGRWPGRAPIGYANRTSPDGKKFIMPKQPEADHTKWSFQQLATGSYTAGRNEEEQFVKSIHEPLISESLFRKVQLIVCKDRNKRSNKETLKILFPLRGFMTCPWCGGKITGSLSQGKRLKYAYYHCMGYKCKGRFRAEKLNSCYEEKLKKIHLRPEVYALFGLVLEDENIFTRRREYIDEPKKILNTISKQKLYISKARRFFLDDGNSNLKSESNTCVSSLLAFSKQIGSGKIAE